MKLSFEVSENAVNLLRRAGYAFMYRNGEEMSFARAFSRSGYPRFHMFVKMEGRIMHMSIHLDQKRETYGNDTRHHGEYEDSPVLQEEVSRLKQIIH